MKRIEIERSKDEKVLAQLNQIVQTWHAQHYPAEFKPFQKTQVEDAFRVLLSKREVHAFVAQIEGQAIGYLLCMIRERKESAFQYPKTILYIDQIAVAEAHRNRGVAQQLLAEAEHLAHQEGVSTIQLDHWAQNDKAATLFTKNGFEYFNQRMMKQLGE